jgi:hypothetical protein
VEVVRRIGGGRRVVSRCSAVERTQRLLQGHTSQIVASCVSADKRFIATADSEWKARAEKAERERDEALRRRTRAERVGEAVIEWASRQTAELITEYAKALERHDWKPHAELTYAIADALKEADDAE